MLLYKLDCLSAFSILELISLTASKTPPYILGKDNFNVCLPVLASTPILTGKGIPTKPIKKPINILSSPSTDL